MRPSRSFRGNTSVSPVERLSTQQQACEILRKAIIEGALALGAPLSEIALSQELGISRTPLREALQALQNEGLVYIEPYKGTRVFTLTCAQLQQLGQFRATLETSALKMAMQSARAALLVKLNAIIDQMQHSVEAADTEGFSRLDTQLHEALINHCGNQYLIQAHTVVGSRLAVLRNLLRRDTDVIGRSCNDHRGLLTLVHQGRDQDAIEFLGLHIANGTEFFTGSLDSVLSKVTTLHGATAYAKFTSRGLKTSK